MVHRNAQLTVYGRRLLITQQRCQGTGLTDVTYRRFVRLIQIRARHLVELVLPQSSAAPADRSTAPKVVDGQEGVRQWGQATAALSLHPEAAGLRLDYLLAIGTLEYP